LLADFATQPALIDAMIEVRGLPPCRFEDPQWQAAAALFELLPHLVVELQFEFQASGVVDYAELARAGRAALASDDEVGDAALALDFRLQHVLIDEMQDTSVSQYVLLQRLTAGWSDGDGRTVFVVGDPMQSIYRFRQADVGRFVRLRETGLPTVPLQSLQLTTNFRSDPAIVAWCNETFANVFPPRDNERAGAVRFQASSAARRAAAEAGVAVHPLVDAAATDEAACVAAIVADELARGCQDIAILVRARAHVAALTSALAERAIDHTAVEIDRLLDSEIGARLHALTCALLHDADRLAWLGVLRQPPFGLSLAELRDLTINDRDTPVRVLLADPDRRRRLPADRQALIERFAETLCAVRAAPRASLAERVERLWLEFDGPDWVSDDADLLTADAYFDALRDTAPTDVVLDPVALTQRLLDARSSNYGNTGSRVQVLTMHKAKGLEFDSVILPGLGRAGGTDRAAPLNWLSLADDRDGAVLLALQATRRSEERDPQHAFVARVGQAQVANERLRLLYVACTRARERLHLVGSVARDRRGQPRPAARSLLDALWPALAPRYADIDAPARESGADVAPWLQPGTLRATASQRRVSPHALPEAPAALLPVPLAEAVEYCWAGNTARIVGTAVHRWLDLLAQRGSLEAAQAWYEAQHSAVRAEMAETGLRGRALDAAVQRFNAAVRRSLADERGRWVLFGPHRRSATELAVTGMIDGTLRNVVLDRCFETRDGEHWIVDYKTSSHEGGAIETFLAQEVERYRPQLDGYRQVYAELTGAVPRTALYYPLLGRFIEVSV
ncbi:MAG: 3'-5' exonuclease, partial [Pseudomonadota bacterium]